MPSTQKIKRSERGPVLTRQRQIVLDVVRSGDHHPTAAEVFMSARETLPGISFATVYNSLRFLKDAGLVREIAFGNGASRYDRETDRHDHAMCSACGKLVDFDLPGTVALTRSAARASKFKAESVHLTLVGLCPACRDGKSSTSS
ncbi:MAG TPA: transcriptional repressor [Blastocatellia bacterium]|nr:transcriptional repressor [Blastocatellia bacterium]